MFIIRYEILNVYWLIKTKLLVTHSLSEMEDLSRSVIVFFLAINVKHI